MKPPTATNCSLDLVWRMSESDHLSMSLFGRCSSQMADASTRRATPVIASFFWGNSSWSHSTREDVQRLLSGAELEDAKNGALVHLRNWVVLARQAREAEFPGFDNFGAFHIFNVEAVANSTAAWLYRCCATQLPKAQSSLSRADRRFESWVWGSLAFCSRAPQENRSRQQELLENACTPTQSKISPGGRHPIAALRPVLAAFFAWSTSSSGVEQLFSKAKGNHLERGSGATLSASDSERRSYIALSNGAVNDNLKELIPAVQALYMPGRGPARAQVRPHIDQGIKMKASADASATEAAWLRRRRADLDGARVAGNHQAHSETNNGVVNFNNGAWRLWGNRFWGVMPVHWMWHNECDSFLEQNTAKSIEYDPTWGHTMAYALIFLSQKWVIDQWQSLYEWSSKFDHYQDVIHARYQIWIMIRFWLSFIQCHWLITHFWDRNISAYGIPP